MLVLKNGSHINETQIKSIFPYKRFLKDDDGKLQFDNPDNRWKITWLDGTSDEITQAEKLELEGLINEKP